MTPDEIRARLFAFAEARAAAGGYRLGTGAAELMGQMCATAAGNVLERVGPGGSPGKLELCLRQAEAALGVYVEEMIAAARRIPGYAEDRSGLIGERTFDMARIALCPCWPIC